MNVKDKITIITGGASGIGEACAKVFSGQKATCYILDLDVENGNRVAEETNSRFIEFDITNRSQTAEIFDGIYREHGAIDILVNSAGIAHPSTPTVEFPDDVCDKLMEINFTGIYNTCKLALKYMIKNKYGRIVNVSSAAGIHATAQKAVYSASKAAVNAFTKAIAREYGKQGIAANAICPGVVITPMTINGGAAVEGSPFYKWWQENCPMGRMGEAEETANLALFLASENCGFVTGQAILQDGGFV